MITAKFKDIYGTEIKVQQSRSGFFRLDFKGDTFLEKEHLGEKVPCCISLDENTARVLLCCLQSLFDEE